MKAEDIRDGDIVEIDYIEEFTKEHINKGKALVLWKGFHNQPLIMLLDREEYYPIWTCYEYISKVVGYVPIGEILKDKSDMDRCNKRQTGKWICEGAISRQAVIDVIWENSNSFRNNLAQGFFADKVKELPSVQPLSVLDDIKAEIRQIVDEETEHDETWSRGLHYALCIIDKHTQ